MCIWVPNIIVTSLSYSPRRPLTSILRTSKVELSNAKALKYLTFQSCSESQTILNYYIMSLSSTKFTKHEKNPELNITIFAVYTLHINSSHITFQMKMTIQKPRINHGVCQYFSCYLTFNMLQGRNVNF